MRSTPLSVFIVTAVCTLALSSRAMAGGHGRHHGHGSHPHMMPTEPMMPMDGGMTAADRAFFTNDTKAPVRKASVTPRDRNR